VSPGPFALNAATFLPLLIVLIVAIHNTSTPVRAGRVSIGSDIREGLKFVWSSPGTRRLTIMSLIFMFFTAPLQGLLPVFAQSVLKGGPTLFGLMLSAIGLGVDPGRFHALVDPSVLPSAPPHSPGDVRLCSDRPWLQLFEIARSAPVW